MVETTVYGSRVWPPIVTLLITAWPAAYEVRPAPYEEVAERVAAGGIRLRVPPAHAYSLNLPIVQMSGWRPRG